jgi:mannose-1-phosphate guanylyltransferase/mannose-6-phosphate isomerase
MYAIILAGGGGTRLWPLSRPERPKPFHALVGSRTLIQATWDRIVPGLVGPEDLFVVTDGRYADLVRDQLPLLPTGNLVVEPVGRNTTAAIALATVVIDRPEDEPMLVLPADHLVRDEEGFRRVLAEAAGLAAGASRWLVTLGIAPTGPETGYGYVVAADPLPGTAGALAVARFVEKPSADAAAALIAGTAPVAWNAGIFCWRRDAIRAALRSSAPDVLDAVADGAAGGRGGLARAYASVRDVSIDYAVMEPAAAAGRVAMLRADVGWSDLGSWSALRDALAEQATTVGAPANVVGRGNRRDVGSDATLVFAGARLVVTIGLHDVIVVDTPDALLVAAADRSQDVRRIAADAARREAEAEAPAPGRER